MLALQESQAKKHNKINKKHVSEEIPSFFLNNNSNNQEMHANEDYPELPKNEIPLEIEEKKEDFKEKADETSEKNEKKGKSTEQLLENNGNSEEIDAQKQYFLSDYIMGELNLQKEKDPPSKANKKGKKPKKIILFSNSLNHY